MKTGRRLLTLLAIVAAAGCSDRYENLNPPANPPAASAPSGAYANVQFLHASPDAPPVSVLLDDAAVAKLDYGQGTGEQSVASGSHSVTIQALPPGAPPTVIGPTSLTLSSGTDTVIVAEGDVANIGSAVFTHTLATVSPASTRVQVLHAAPSAPSVAVFVTAPGASLESSTPLGTFAYGGSLGPTVVPSGQYEIRVTPAGATTPVLFDSGTTTLSGGADLVIAALQNTGPGTAPIVLSVLDATGKNSLLVDVGTPASLRVVHDSPNAPPVSVLATAVGGTVDASSPLVPTLAYEGATAYLSVLPTGNYDIEVTPASNTSDVLINRELPLNAGSVQTFYAIGNLATIAPLITQDDDRRYATQAKLRIIHVSPSAGPVDIYLTTQGASIATLSPTYAAVPFGADTGFVSYAAGSYALTITPTGSKTAAIGPLTVSLNKDGIYTAVARDAPGGGGPLGLILLDDFTTSQ